MKSPHQAPKDSKDSKVRGFTLIELLISVGILIIIGLLLIQGFERFFTDRSLDGTVSQIHAMLNKARHQTLTSKNGAAYGVRFNTQEAYLYQGTFSSSSPIQTLSINKVVTISTLSLAGGTNDVRFIKLTGETNATGTIVVRLADNASTTRTITIYQSGLVDTR